MTLLLVLSPSHLRGAKVVAETKDEGSPEGFVLDRKHPTEGDLIWVGQDDVTVATVPECCWAAETAMLQERLYAAYNLGGPVNRAGLAWNGLPVPTWAELQERAADNDVGAIGVITKWEAVAQAIDQMGDGGTFGWALRQLKNGHRVRRAGWYKDCWLGLQVPDEHSKMGLPYIFVKISDGKMCPWSPSNPDLLAMDWGYAD